MPGSLALLLLVAAVSVAAADDHQAEQARDLVTSLPGQPKVAFKQYAGYVTVSRTAGRALFYWFIEAAHNASSKPLALWLNGGPGCSSIGYGAMEEIGPFRMDKTSLALNPYSWNKAANLLFLESPAGVGFSYSNTSTDYSKSGDKRTAKDAYVFLKRWFQRFSHYKQRDFYIMGESYAGHYVPQLAKRIHDGNARSQHPIRLRGFMVGNALMDDKADRMGRIDYWYTHALISRRTYTSIVRSCGLDGHSLAGVECIDMLRYARGYEQGDIDPYSIYSPVCVSNSSSASIITTNRSARFRDPVFGDVPYYGYDPCVDDYVESYFNRRDVQQAMHANQVTWSACSDVVHANWQDSVDTVLPIYKELIKAGLRIWVYSGDVDSVVPVTSSRYSIEKLELNTTTPWYPWYRNDQVGGYTEVYDGLTMATVRGAGHEVPLFQPGRALTLLRSFLDGKPLPRRI